MNKRTVRRARAAVSVAATAALLAALAACSADGGGSAPSDEPTGTDTGSSNRPEGEIHIAIYGSGDVSIEEAMVEKFNETSEIKAILDPLPGGDDYQQKLQSIMGTDNAPDIFFNFGGGSIIEYVEADLLMPLTDFIEEDPQLESAFLPSVFDVARIDGVPYGIPMRPVQPGGILYYNKDVLADAGLEPPATWDDLLDAVDVLEAKGITPIALGGADKWPTAQWFMSVYSRVVEPGFIDKALAGDTSVWESEDSRRALEMLRDLVDRGAFGDAFDAVSFVGGASGQLLRDGRAAFELQGSWAFGGHLAADPEFTANSLGYMAFPAVPDGNGAPGAIQGNPSNYYSVLKATRYPDAVREFLELMYSPELAEMQLATGGLPPTTTGADLIPQAANPEFVQFTYDLVAEAPHFQLSWDQAYPVSSRSAINDAAADFFSGRLDVQGFIDLMKTL